MGISKGDNATAAGDRTLIPTVNTKKRKGTPSEGNEECSNAHGSASSAMQSSNSSNQTSSKYHKAGVGYGGGGVSGREDVSVFTP